MKNKDDKKDNLIVKTCDGITYYDYPEGFDRDIMWQKDEMISKKQGYEAMLHMLNSWWELTDEFDLRDILSGGEYLSDSIPVDTAFWEYWIKAIEKNKKEGPIYLVLIKD